MGLSMCEMIQDFKNENTWEKQENPTKNIYLW